MLKNHGFCCVFNVTGGHIETLIKRGGFGRPGKQLPCETLVGSDPRRAAQGICDFWELPAWDRILSLRGLLGSAPWDHGAPCSWNVQKCCLSYGIMENS